MCVCACVRKPQKKKGLSELIIRLEEKAAFISHAVSIFQTAPQDMNYFLVLKRRKESYIGAIFGLKGLYWIVCGSQHHYSLLKWQRK